MTTQRLIVAWALCSEKSANEASWYSPKRCRRHFESRHLLPLPLPHQHVRERPRLQQHGYLQWRLCLRLHLHLHRLLHRLRHQLLLWLRTRATLQRCSVRALRHCHRCPCSSSAQIIIMAVVELARRHQVQLALASWRCRHSSERSAKSRGRRDLQWSQGWMLCAKR